MITYKDDYNKQTIWDLSEVNDRVHIVIRKESRNAYEALSLDAARELHEQLGNMINLIEERQ